MRLQLAALIEGLAHLGHTPEERRDTRSKIAFERALIERALHAEKPSLALIGADIKWRVKRGDIGRAITRGVFGGAAHPAADKDIEPLSNFCEIRIMHGADHARLG